MASSLRLITSNLVTRSFLPTVVSASRSLSINGGHRCCTTVPIEDFYYQSCVKMMSPKTSSMSFRMSMSNDRRLLDLKTGSKDSDIGMSVLLIMDGLEKKDMRAFFEQNIQGKTHKDGYLAGSKLLVKTSIDTVASDIIASFREISTKHSWAYHDMFFDRSVLINNFCHVIAMSPTNSFSIYKKEDTDWLEISTKMPGKQKMKSSTQGLHMSLKMAGLKRRDVKIFFHYDILFIEGKTKKEHYITGIHLPKGTRKKHNMIKRQVKDGVLYAIIPCCVKKEEIKIDDQLKPITN